MSSASFANMLLAFILLVYTFLLTHLLGLKMFILLHNWFTPKEVFIPQTGLSNIIGLAIMSPIIAVYHLFFNIDFVLHLFFISLVISNLSVIKILLKKLGSEMLRQKWEYSFLFLAGIVSITIRPGHGDIADYHLQGIRWAENYPNIIGLGNFNRPLSNNNWWFNLQAFLGLRFLGLKSVYTGNTLFFIATFLYLLNLKEMIKGKWFIWILLAFMVLCLKTAFVGSVTPDFIITCLAFLCGTLYYQYFIEVSKLKGMLLCIFLLCCFAITVKLNAFPFLFLALLALWELIQKKIINVNLIRFIAIATVFFIPWLIGNIVISGWLAYPVDSIDLFNVDWKVPKELLQFERFSIKQWGKNPGEDIYITAQMNFFQWLPKWFAYHDLFNKCLIVTTVISAFVLLLTKQTYQNKAIRGLFIFAIFGLLFCLSNGPHIRYVFGYMLLLIALSVQLLLARIKAEPPILAWKFLKIGMIAITLLQATIFIIKQPSQLVFESIIYPKSYSAEILPLQQMGSKQVIITANNNSCWDQFPCTYYLIEGCTLRGNSFTDGFKVVTEINNNNGFVVE